MYFGQYFFVLIRIIKALIRQTSPLWFQFFIPGLIALSAFLLCVIHVSYEIREDPDGRIVSMIRSYWEG